MISVSFHGVRGSTPCHGPDTHHFGGNTSCVSLCAPGQVPVVFDLGTGLRYFGKQCGDTGAFRAVCLLTHLHYDHIGNWDRFPKARFHLQDKEMNFATKYFEDRDAIEHLFRVSMGLEAQVVGDMQISNQVKRAYQASADLDMAGPFLHRLMHMIFFTSKRLVQETAFRDGAASVSYAAVELIEELTSNTYQPRVLLIGVGEIGEDVAKNMVHIPDAKVTITNRTFERAKALADEMGFEVIPFENCFEAMKEADVIVSSIMKSEPYITKKMVSEIEINSYKLFVDLSVPRSIETNLEEIPGVMLYNVDNIRSKATETLEKRLASIPQVEKIITESIEDYMPLNDLNVQMSIKRVLKDEKRHEYITNKLGKDYNSLFKKGK